VAVTSAHAVVAVTPVRRVEARRDVSLYFISREVGIGVVVVNRNRRKPGEASAELLVRKRRARTQVRCEGARRTRTLWLVQDRGRRDGENQSAEALGESPASASRWTVNCGGSPMKSYSEIA
jgi:hypothetical protein